MRVTSKNKCSTTKSVIVNILKITTVFKRRYSIMKKTTRHENLHFCHLSSSSSSVVIHLVRNKDKKEKTKKNYRDYEQYI